MNDRAITSLCCHGDSLGGQHSNTSPSAGNTAGNTRATQATEGPSLLEIARNRLRNARATQAETGRQHKGSYPQACVASLADNFALVVTWWQWPPEDIATFQAWARQHHDQAAAWVHAEAERVRHLRDRLHVANATDFLRPTQDRIQTATPPSPLSERTAS